MKKKLTAQITLEAAIVVPVLILIVLSLLYFAFYIHDVLIIRGYAYISAVENADCELDEFSQKVKESMRKAPSLIINPIVNCYKKNGTYYIEIKGVNTSDIACLNTVIQENTFIIKIEERMDSNKMYAIRNAIDFCEK